MKKIQLLAVIICMASVVFGNDEKPVRLSSPDKLIQLTVENKNGKLFYSVSYHNKMVIQPSNLGIIVNDKLIGENATQSQVKHVAVNETYAYRGIHSLAVNHYNGITILYHSSSNTFTLEAKVFNDGVAFRYVIDNNDSAISKKENTQFIIPAGSIVWSQPNIKYYEGKYTKKLVDTIRQGEIAGPPSTIELPENAGYAAITEGGLTDFGGMSLLAEGNNSFIANLTGITRKKGMIETPWRIIEIGKDLNTLVNCDIVANVSPSFDKKLFPGGYETDWVKPGRSVWSWLAGRGPVTLENMKRFTDDAAALGFEYNLVDEGWANWKDTVNHRDNWDMMKELVDYANAKGVKTWVWKAYPDRKGIAGIKDEKQRKIFFQKCKDLGIAGLKVDFFDSEAQEIIQFYQAALHDAAEYQLMMDFHGANKPTGETRTWPNEMSREGIRGLENRPPHAYTNTILPFTRYLAGHADFTPLHFGERLGESSWAHQVASMVIFTSPFLCLGADPKTILNNPCKSIIQSIPPTWDETIVLPQSKIGELVLFARRKGTSWFIAAMNGVNETKTIAVDLSFLKGNYILSSVKDDKEKQANTILGDEKINSKTTLTITLNANGGYMGRLDAVK